MKYTKMLGLIAVAAATLMAFCGTASATLTEAPSDPVDSDDLFHASSEGAVSLTGSINVTCQKSTIDGGFATNNIIEVDVLTFEECGNHTVTTVLKGLLSVDSNGLLKSEGMLVTVLLHSALLGTLHCLYETNQTYVGEFTDRFDTGGTATLDIPSKTIPRVVTDAGCGEHSTWEGSYKVEIPDYLVND